MLDRSTDFTQGISVADSNSLSHGVFDSFLPLIVAMFIKFSAECGNLLF